MPSFQHAGGQHCHRRSCVCPCSVLLVFIRVHVDVILLIITTILLALPVIITMFHNCLAVWLRYGPTVEYYVDCK